MSVETGGLHGRMDLILIDAPVEIEGLPIIAMNLTRGEVAEFWIPLAFTIDGGRAVMEAVGYDAAIQNFEVAIYYDKNGCEKSVQGML